jgi:anti-anti-sigma factor
VAEKEKRIVIVKKVISADEVEISLEGNLSRDDMNDFQARLDEALLESQRTIVLNFERLSSLSSSAIGKILHFKKQCDEAGRRLVIRRCSTEMLQLLRMIKFEALITIEP